MFFIICVRAQMMFCLIYFLIYLFIYLTDIHWAWSMHQTLF